MNTIDRMSQLGIYTERGLGSSTSIQSTRSINSSDNQFLPHHMKHIASSLTLFGPDSHEAIQNSIQSSLTSPPPQQTQIQTQGTTTTTTIARPSTSSKTSSNSSTSSTSTTTLTKLSFQPNYTPWTNLNYHKVIYHSPISLHGYYRSCCVLSNSQSILPSITRSVQQGTAMFGSGAYLHQYTTCGLELDEFITSFRYLGHVIQNYKEL